jgi:hypothetical protein
VVPDQLESQLPRLVHRPVLGPSNSWQLATPLIEPIEGTGQTNQFTDTFPHPTGRVFRLEVKIPTS